MAATKTATKVIRPSLKKMPPPKMWMTRQEAATYLDISIRFLDLLRERGKLKSKKISYKKVLIDFEDIKAMLENC